MISKVRGAGLVSHFLRDRLCDLGQTCFAYSEQGPPALSRASMGIVSPTVAHPALEALYTRRYVEFIARYASFISGPSYRVTGGQVWRKENSVTLDVNRLLDSLPLSAKPKGDANWTVLTGIPLGSSICQTFTLETAHCYNREYEGCSFAVKDADTDIYYRFQNGCIYFGCDRAEIHQVYQDLFQLPCAATVRSHVIPEGPNGLPFIEWDSREIRTGNTGSHGILAAYVVACEIADLIVHGTSPHSLFCHASPTV